jgi:hypothetical protein
VISLANAETASPTFLAPTVDEDRLLTFELSVSDGGVTTSDTMTVLVQAPTSDAKAPQVISGGCGCELDGTRQQPQSLWLLLGVPFVLRRRRRSRR